MTQSQKSDIDSKMAGVKAMMAFSEYLRKNISFKQSMKRLAEEQDIAGLICLTRNVPELAPFVDTLIEVRHFDLFIKKI